MAYRRLIAEHPDSRFVADAMVEILVALYNEGKFKEADDHWRKGEVALPFVL